ncbi:MAG: hypothetical protein K2G44_02455 [Clostridia bacterium]|nr:hypothetical protein [Clostridia bacterium]
MRKLRYFFGGRLFPCALIFAASVGATVVLAVWLPRALAPVALAERLFSLIAALFIVCAKEPPEFKLSKIVLIVFLPWTGGILALVWLRRTPNANPPETINCLAESIEYFPVGKEMYERLLTDITNAEKFIWLEYYIVAHGAFFHALSEVLERKAKEGVDVRLLYDDFGCSFTLPKRFEKEQAKRGIKAYAVRRIRFPSRAANRRNHRKIAVIDGEIAYTGGINLADEYIGEKIRFGHWKDTAVRVTGAPASAFAKLLASDMPRALNLPEIKPQEGNIPCAVIADSAEDTQFRAGGAALCSLISAAEKSVWLFTPYLAPDTALLSALETAARAGKDVRIMIPHIPDKKFTFLITQSYAQEMTSAGVQIREYTAGFLHAKSVTCDGKRAFVSTYNLDFRSLYLQAECGLYAESEELANALERDFTASWEAGTPLKKASPLKRAVGAVLRLFAPLV